MKKIMLSCLLCAFCLFGLHAQTDGGFKFDKSKLIYSVGYVIGF